MDGRYKDLVCMDGPMDELLSKMDKLELEVEVRPSDLLYFLGPFYENNYI